MKGLVHKGEVDRFPGGEVDTTVKMMLNNNINVAISSL